jgi:Cytochrome C assembly protein
MLAGISLLCFTASYAVALALEISRLFFRMPVRLVVMIGFAAAGLMAHSLYLWNRAQLGATPLSSWHDWYLIASWVLAATYLALVATRPQTNVGLFLLPVVLVLAAIAWAFPRDDTFPRDRALQMWGVAHGVMLLLGTIAVSFGFAAGLMYLVQSWRLKQHAPHPAGLRLPSLEWLQAVNKQSLVYSSCFIALGLVAGIVLNAVKAAGRGGSVPWTDSVVISSAVLLVWLLAATLFEWLYKPAQQGRKVAYLTIASFLFLALVVAVLLVGESQHARPQGTQSSRFKVQSSMFLFAGCSTLNFELGALNSTGRVAEDRS